MFKTRIQEKYGSLSARFRVIADYILEHTLEASFLTATELARQLKIDPATVVRFSQELGYSGYRDLAREIKRYVSTELTTRYQRPVAEAQSLEERIEHLIAEQSDRVLSLKASSAALAEAVRRIQAARQVIFTGAGEAGHLAELWATWFTLIGIPSRSLQASPDRLGLAAEEVDAGTLLIVLSLGLVSESDLIYALRVFKEHGAYTLAVLPSPTLLPAREADLHLVAEAQTPSGYPGWDNLVVLMSLLWQAVIFLDPERARQHLQQHLSAMHLLQSHNGENPPEDLAALKRLWQME